MAGGLLCVMSPNAAQTGQAWYSRFGTYDPFVYELHRNSPIFRGFWSTWVRFSEALAGALGLADQDQLRCFDRISIEFAEIFDVSTEAMRIRLQKLGLLHRNAPRQGKLAGVV
jgi:hypothetical protein